MHFFFLMSIFHARMCLHPVCAWCQQRSEEGLGSLGIVVTDGCEPACGCWELNPDPPMQE